MALKSKLVSVSAATMLATLYAASPLANVQIWNFNSSSQGVSDASSGDSLNLTYSDGVNLTMTGRSENNDISGDNAVETGTLVWATTNGIGPVNEDEDTGSSTRSVDSAADESDDDFDRSLLEFDIALNLASLRLNWTGGGVSSDRTDISLLAWDGTGSSALPGNNWGGILDRNGGSNDAVGNYSYLGLSYYTVNPTIIKSTKWLVGVYNPLVGFGGSAGKNGFKPTSLKTSTTTPTPDLTTVSIPGTLALVLAGLLGLRARKPLKATA